MNIFVLDTDPKKAAQYHCDKHVVKMMLESAQVLGSCVWNSNGVSNKKLMKALPFETIEKIWKDFPRKHSDGKTFPYGIGFMNHPCTKWTRESEANWNWLCSLALELTAEYERRYKKTSAMKAIIEWFIANSPSFTKKDLTPFPQAMPDNLRSTDAVHSYKMYYASYKPYFAKWKTGEPAWWLDYLQKAKDNGLIDERSLPAAEAYLSNKN